MVLARYYDDDSFVDRTLPKTVEAKNIGLEQPQGRIEDVIFAGSKLKVVDVIRTRVEFDHWTWFVCDVEVAGIIKWKKVSTIFIQSSTDGADMKLPILRPETAEEEDNQRVQTTALTHPSSTTTQASLSDF